MNSIFKNTKKFYDSRKFGNYIYIMQGTVYVENCVLQSGEAN